MCLARCSLRVKLSWQGGKSVQKNRCAFFFFEGLSPSLPTLSLSEPSSSFSSSSASPISMSCESRGVCAVKCELSRFDASFRGLSIIRALDDSSGSGLCPSTPPNECLVGVLAVGSSSFVVADWAPWVASDCRGVVGVCTFPVWVPSGTRRLVLTMAGAAI